MLAGAVAIASSEKSIQVGTTPDGLWLKRDNHFLHVDGATATVDRSTSLRGHDGIKTATIVTQGKDRLIVETPQGIWQVDETTIEVLRTDPVRAAAAAKELPGPGATVLVYASDSKIARIPEDISGTQILTLPYGIRSAARQSDDTLWQITSDGAICSIPPPKHRTPRCAGSIASSGALDGALVITGDRPLYVAPSHRVAAWVGPDGLGRIIRLPDEVDASARVNAWNGDSELTLVMPGTHRLMIARVGESSLTHVRWTTLDAADYLAPVSTDDAVGLVDKSGQHVVSVDKHDLSHRQRGKPVGPNPHGTLKPDGYAYITGDGPYADVISPFGDIATVSMGDPDRRTPDRKSPQQHEKRRPPAQRPIVTKPTPPGAPSPVTATAGDASAHVAWGEAPANGAAVTRYVIEWTGADGSRGTTALGSDARSASIGNLVNGVAYTIAVRAVNAVGSGPAADAPPVVPAADLPPAPRAVVAAARADATADLTWFPGDSRPVTYEIAAIASGGAPVVVARGVTTTSYSVGSAQRLRPGTAYRFTVTAISVGGVAGPASAPSNAVTLAGPSDAPSNAGADPAGDSSLRVHWSPPADTNGGTVFQYEIRSDKGQSATVGATATEAVFSGLNNGTPYTFTIRAVTRTDAGDVRGSPATAQAVPGGPPGLGTFNAAASGDRTIRVSFDVDDNQSGPVTCHVDLDSSERWTGACAGSFSIDVSGLAYSTAYDVWAWASNGYGSSVGVGHISVTTNPPPPVVGVSKGASVQSPTCTSSACAWVRVQMSGFSPNTRYSIRCYASTDPSGWYTYSVVTDGAGNSDTSNGCYYGFSGKDVWVVAGNVESNHLTW